MRNYRFRAVRTERPTPLLAARADTRTVPLGFSGLGRSVTRLFGLSLFGISGAQAVPVAFIVFAVLTIPLWLLGILALATAGLSIRSAVRLSSAP